MTSLLDMLKETDLRVGFTEDFRARPPRESLDRDDAAASGCCSACTAWGPTRA